MYPTSLRARGVGFVYSFSRLSIVVSSFVIALLLRRFWPFGVFLFFSCSIAIVGVTVGFFCPRTRGHGDTGGVLTLTPGKKNFPTNRLSNRGWKFRRAARRSRW